MQTKLDKAFKIIVDISNRKVTIPQAISWYVTDENIAHLYCQVIDEVEDSIIDIQSYKLSMRVLTPSRILKEVNYTLSDVTNNIFTLTLPDELITEKGRHQCELSIEYLGDKLTSEPFNYNIIQSIANQLDSTISKDSHYPLVLELEDKLKEWNNILDEQVSKVIILDNDVRNAEKTRQANEAQRIEAENGRREGYIEFKNEVSEELESVNSQLSAKRDKNIKLNSNDLDISDDNLKIKLVNLSEEVRGAIAGTSTVIGDVADNSITNSKLANGVITSDKLHKDFNYKKDLNSSDDLNSPLDSGIYFIGANHPANTPETIKGKSCVLHHIPIMGYYSIQVLYPFNNDNFVYYRTTHYTASQNNTQWKNLKDINITTNELTREYNYHGILNDSNDLNNITNLKTGVYLIQNNSLPSNIPTLNTCILYNYNYLGNYAHQFIIEYNNPSIIYNRKVDANNSSYNSKWINLNSKNLINKKILTLGDSITYGATSTNNYQDMFEEVLGCEVVNSGYSGSKYALIENHEPWNTHSFYNKSITLDLTDIDYIWIMYGVNDWNNEVPIGDRNSDEYTTCGALYKGLKNLLTRKPTLKIFASTPIFTCTEDGSTQIDIDEVGNKSNIKLEEYCKSIKEIYNHFRIPVFDGLNECGINLYNHNEYLTDKLHPNNEGNNLIGLRFANFIKQYV